MRLNAYGKDSRASVAARVDLAVTASLGGRGTTVAGRTRLAGSWHGRDGSSDREDRDDGGELHFD